MTSALTRLAAHLRIKPMTRERVERMYPPVGVCEICRQPAAGSLKLVYDGLAGRVLALLTPRRYVCCDFDHIEQMVSRLRAENGKAGEKP